MNPLKNILGKKSKKDPATSSIKLNASDHGATDGSRRRKSKTGLSSSTNSRSGQVRRTSTQQRRNSRRGSASGQGASPMHPSEMIAMLERRASLGGDQEAAQNIFEMMKSGEFSETFDEER